MIPSTTAFLEQDFEIEEQPTHTYKMNLASELVRGYTDYQEAMKQAIYKILNTERYQYVMYSWNYGTWDDRIKSVDNFEFNISKKGEILVTFTAHTVFGDVVAEKVVNF